MKNYIVKENAEGKYDVKITNPRSTKGGFRKLDENSLEDVPYRNIRGEDNARLAAAVVSQYGNTRKGKWKE